MLNFNFKAMDPIPTGVSVAGMLAGGIGSAIYKNKARKANEKAQQDNLDTFNAQYYSDYTKRADVQSVLGRMRDQMQKNQQRARNTAAVTGATAEAAIASQSADNDALGQTMQSLAGQASAHKDNVQQRYDARKEQLTDADTQQNVDQANQFANLASNAATTVLGQFEKNK